MTEALIESPSLRFRTASLLSDVFNPLYWAVPASLAAALKVSSSVASAFLWWLLYITFSTLVPLADLLVRLRTGRISDFHVTKREERTRPIIDNIISISIGVILFFVLGAPRELTGMALAGWGLVVVTLMVNLWWKISLHAMGLWLIYILLVLIFGTWTFVVYNFYMVLIIVAVCWARVYLGKHTPGQVIAGSLVGACIPVLCFLSLGLLT